MKSLLTMLCAGLFALTTLAGEKQSTPRDTFVAYFKAMESRQADTAKALKTPDCIDTLHMNIHALNIVNRLRPFYQYTTLDQALVVAHPFTISKKVTNRDEVIYAELIRQDGAWRIRNLARTAPGNMSWLVKGFQMHADVKLDLTTDALVGEWRYPCASIVVMRADGTGSELEVGSGGPTDDQKPEPFTWSVDGSALTRRFSDREDRLTITSIDHEGVRFKTPNPSHQQGWWREYPEKK